MIDEVLRGSAKPRLVSIWLCNQRPGIVRDEHLRNAAIEFHRVDQPANPVRRCLRARRAGIRVVRCAEHGNEDMGFKRDAAGAIEDRHGLPGEVGEQFFAGAVLLAHRALERLRVVLVPPPELRIAVRAPTSMGLDVFFPEQLQSHALTSQLPVNHAAIRLDTFCRNRRRRGQQHTPLELSLFHRLRHCPVKAGRGS